MQGLFWCERGHREGLAGLSAWGPEDPSEDPRASLPRWDFEVLPSRVPDGLRAGPQEEWLWGAAPRLGVTSNGVSSQLSGTLAGDLEEHAGGSWGHFPLPPFNKASPSLWPAGGGLASRKQKGVRTGCHVWGGFPLAGSLRPLALMGSRDLGVEIPPPLTSQLLLKELPSTPSHSQLKGLLSVPSPCLAQAPASAHGSSTCGHARPSMTCWASGPSWLPGLLGDSLTLTQSCSGLFLTFVPLIIRAETVPPELSIRILLRRRKEYI